MNPVNTLTPYFFKIYFNIIFMFRHRSPNLSHPLKFSGQNFERGFYFPQSFTYPAHITHVVHPSNIRCVVQCMKDLVTHSSPASSPSFPSIFIGHSLILSPSFTFSYRIYASLCFVCLRSRDQITALEPLVLLILM